MEPGYETLTIKSPDGTVNVQAGVECKLPVSAEEIARVLSLTARAVPLSAEPAEGEAKIAGRVLFIVLYTDQSGNLKKCECGVECRCGVKDDRISPETDLFLTVRAENAHFRTQGGTVYLAAVMTAEARLSTRKTVQAMRSLDGAVQKTEDDTLISVSEGMKSTASVEDAWEESLCLADVLSYHICAEKTAVSAGVGSIAAEGVCRVILLVKASGGEISAVSHQTEFSVAMEDNDCMPGMTADVAISIGEVHFDVVADPDKNSSKINMTADLLLTGALYKESEVTLLSGAFSEERLLQLHTETYRLELVPEEKTETVRLNAKAPLSAAVSAEAKVLAVLPAGVYPAGITAENGSVTAEGVLTAAVYYAEEGTVKALTCDLPLSVKTQTDTDALALAEAVFSVSQFAADFAGEGELSVTAIVKAAFTLRPAGDLSVITEAEEGEERKPRPGAISVFFPKAGDGLWELGSSLGVAPEKIMECNPDLHFPLSGEERVLLYCKKAENYAD